MVCKTLERFLKWTTHSFLSGCNTIASCQYGQSCLFSLHLLEEAVNQSLQRRRLRSDLILAVKNLKGEINLGPFDFFLRPPQTWLRRHAYRVLQEPNRIRRRNGAFFVCVVKYWDRLPNSLVFSNLVFVFFNQVDCRWSEIFPEDLCDLSLILTFTLPLL